MTLENHLSSERVNVRHLAVELSEKRAEPLFDPEKEISTDDWQKLADWYKAATNRGNPMWGANVNFVANCKLLSPRFEEVIPIDWKALVDGAKKEITENVRPGNLGDTLMAAASLKQLSPEATLNLELERHWQAIVSVVGTLRRASRQFRDNELVRFLLAVKILFPHHVADLHMSDDDKSRMIDSLNEERKVDDYGGIVISGMRLRLLFPNAWTEQKITTQECEGVKSVMAKISRTGDNMSAFSYYAACLAIATADSAEIDDQGIIQISRKPQALVATPPLSEIRKF